MSCDLIAISDLFCILLENFLSQNLEKPSMMQIKQKMKDLTQFQFFLFDAITFRTFSDELSVLDSL